jgi:hypothetical protein
MIGLVGGAGDDTAFECDGEGVERWLPAHCPAGPSAAGGVKGSGDQVEALQRGLVGREVPGCPNRSAVAGVERLDRVRIRYEGVGAAGFAGRWPLVGCRRGWITVRPSGIGAPGVDGVGRPVLFGGLRARVSRWPPLRPARLRCARGSVVVVSPTRSRSDQERSFWEGRR